uniref:EF-hand domain-containing protein n=1 Tax=Pyrodinium bahamense TaxID=73915 RepID=A0A7S0FIA1_9DINO
MEPQEPALPEPLRGGHKLGAAGLQDVPTSGALEAWLGEHGVRAKEWGCRPKGKSVEDLWKEVQLQECGLELWSVASGEVRPVRVVHVLRAKVCSPQSYERSVFVFNSWQQFPDGRTRTRNALLSEKLSVAEMPLEEHLHEVCQRAVQQEEMQRLEEAAFRIGPGYRYPEYDPEYACPIIVADEQYVEHSLEIVRSASYPTLLTLYHLYTVEIVCLGLPSVDFTSLEFNTPDQDGQRKLKYVHGWVWLEWSQIQRYLFEGSELKDSKMKGSFKDAAGLTSWLSQFDLELAAWGTDQWKSTEHLFKQVESGETQLEHWGRHDGVPLLMRVVHVVRLEVQSSDPRLLGKFLLQTWQQEPSGSIRTVNRLMTRTMSTLNLPFDDQRLREEAAKTVQEKLGFLVDAHFRLGSCSPSMLRKLENSCVQILNASFVDHHISVDESPSYKGMCTLYHLYDMHAECQGLPFADFASVTFEASPHPGQESDQSKVRVCQGFRWVTWPLCIDIWQSQAAASHRRQEALTDVCRQQHEVVLATEQAASQLSECLERLAAKARLQGAGEGDPDLLASVRLVEELQDCISDAVVLDHATISTTSLTQALPPSMVSEMGESTIVSKETLETATLRRMKLMQRLAGIHEELATPLDMLPTRSTGSCGSTIATAADARRGSPTRHQSGETSQSMPARVEEAFANADVDGSGTIMESELESILHGLSSSLSPRSIRVALAAANASKERKVNYRDFIRWLYEDGGDVARQDSSGADSIA